VKLERSLPPLLTADLPGVGGSLGPDPEDFLVDEIPAYVPSGQGEHVYLRVKKRRMTTRDAALALGRASGVSERDIGYAGMKDKHGVTTQWFSLPRTARDVESHALPPELEVIEVSRHGNKLRTGHLRGNRFVLGIVGAPEGGIERARALLGRLATHGFLNAFGAQRFGRDGEWRRRSPIAETIPCGCELFLSALLELRPGRGLNRYAIARTAWA
jgi:tRNA pseudouridine13 synthase